MLRTLLSMPHPRYPVSAPPPQLASSAPDPQESRVRSTCRSIAVLAFLVVDSFRTLMADDAERQVIPVQPSDFGLRCHSGNGSIAHIQSYRMCDADCKTTRSMTGAIRAYGTPAIISHASSATSVPLD